MKVTFIDTSVLCELLEVPGKNQRAADVQEEFVVRAGLGEHFVIPVTAVIETGNHIVQSKGDRRAAAERLVRLLTAARSGEAPYVLLEVRWDEDFIGALCDGDSTHQSFVDLAGNGLMGAGDVAILVERDRYVDGSGSSRSDVGIWTLEAVLGSFA